MGLRTCPTPTELQEFDTGSLPDEQADQLIEHMRECDLCRAHHMVAPKLSSALTNTIHHVRTELEFEYADEPDFAKVRADLLNVPEPVHADIPVNETTWTQPFGLQVHNFPYRLGNYELLERVGEGRDGCGLPRGACPAEAYRRREGANSRPAQKVRRPGAVSA